MDNLNAEIIANIYAEPLLELASDAQKSEQIKDELEALSGLLAQEHEFVTVLDSPFVQTNEKLSLAEKIFDGRLDRLTTGLLAAVIRRNRIRYIDAIASSYSLLLDKKNGIKLINVTLSKEMSQQEKDSLEQRLEEAAASKIKVNYNIDATILGGIIIQYEGTYVDNSLRRVLADAKVRIKSKIKT